MAPTTPTTTTVLPAQDTEVMQLSDVQVKAYETAQAELDAFRKEMETKKYFADMTEKDIKTLQAFLLNDAPWKYMESLGIREVNKEIQESLAKSKGKLFMGATAFEALAFYLSKVDGTGEKVTAKSIGDIETYIRLLKNINAARASVGEDSKKLQQLEYVAASRSEGLDPAEDTPAN